MQRERPDRSIIALVSAPSGFAGRTDQIPVETPPWNHVEPVNAVLRDLLGVPTSVLRLVSVEGGNAPFGGVVTYHVEAHGEPDRTHLCPAAEPEADAEHRQIWARPGGPAELIDWADAEITRTGPAVQMRTWNLSSVHQLPATDGTMWLKAVPPFLCDESTLIKMVGVHDPTLVPDLVAGAPHRVLLRDEPGGSCWPLEPEHVESIVPRWVAVQHALAGAPQVRPTPVPMPDFGLPDTLLHGDFHPGNTRGDADPDGRSVLLDWGDCGIGNPLLDQAATLASIREEQRGPLRAHWSRLWREAVPGCDPDRAAALLGPVRAFRQALIYQVFLEGIEPSERVYHEGDPHGELRAVRALLR